jgi:hypothetical protein
LATQKRPREDARRKNYIERPDLDTAVYNNYMQNAVYEYNIFVLYFIFYVFLTNLFC